LIEGPLIQREHTIAIDSALLLAGGNFRPARRESGKGCKDME
jgi:hypothetical protein